MKTILIFLFLASFTFPQNNPFDFFLLMDEEAADVTAPAVPQSLAAVGDVGKISLSWDANTETDFLRYILFRNDSNVSATSAAIDSFAIGELTKVDTPLTHGIVYWYWLKSQDATGNLSAFGDAASDTVETNYMASDGENVVLHLVFDTLYANRMSISDLGHDYSSEENDLTPNFDEYTYSTSYSPLLEGGTSVQFAGAQKFALDTAIAVDADFRMGMESFSVECILKMSNTGWSYDRNYFFAKHNPIDPSDTYLLTPADASSGTFYTKLCDTSGYTRDCYSEASINDDKWHYVVLVIDRNDDEIKLYVDGEYDVSVPGEKDISTLYNLDVPKGFLTIGGIDNATSGWYIGEIAEVRVSKRILSVEEISTHWDNIIQSEITCPVPTTQTASGMGGYILLSATEPADSVYWYGDTSPEPTTLRVASVGNGSVNDTTEVGTTYYYRCKSVRHQMNGNRIVSGYSTEVNAASTAELIKEDIDKTLEPVSVYTSDFSAGVDGWLETVGAGRGVLTGNNDGIYGRDDVAKLTATGTRSTAAKQNIFSGIKRYKGNVDYFVPTAATTTAIDMLEYTAGVNFYHQTSITENSWLPLTASGTYTGAISNITGISLFVDYWGTTSGDSIYFTNVKMHQVSNWTPGGNHAVDTTTVQAQAGSYSLKITSTDVGDSTTNFISLDTLKFTQLVPDDSIQLSLYAKSATESTTMYIRIGNNTQTFLLTDGWVKYNYGIVVNTYTVKKKIKIWFDKAATVYIDNITMMPIQE